MKEMEKLRVLLPHWIEHNNGHEAECSKWIEIATENGQKEVADNIAEAVKTMQQVNSLLEKALQQAGGRLEDPHHHHHSH